MTLKRKRMSARKKIHILFFSLWTIEFILTLIAAAKGLKGIMYGGVASGALTLILCLCLQVKYGGLK